MRGLSAKPALRVVPPPRPPTLSCMARASCQGQAPGRIFSRGFCNTPWSSASHLLAATPFRTMAHRDPAPWGSADTADSTSPTLPTHWQLLLEVSQA